MVLSLLSHVHAVAVGDDIVFLDLTSDYLCLVGAASVMRLMPDGAVVVDDPATAQALLEAGLIGEVAPCERRPPPSKPVLDLPPSQRPIRPSDWVALAQACVSTSSMLRFRSFAELIGSTRRRRSSSDAPTATEAVLDAAAAFSRIQPWSPVGGVCLARSYLRLQYLWRRGLDADWVIGVRTWPFMAHCWLQAGDVALDEDVERLVAYTPIMVV